MGRGEFDNRQENPDTVIGSFLSVVLTHQFPRSIIVPLPTELKLMGERHERVLKPDFLLLSPSADEPYQIYLSASPHSLLLVPQLMKTTREFFGDLARSQPDTHGIAVYQETLISTQGVMLILGAIGQIMEGMLQTDTVQLIIDGYSLKHDILRLQPSEIPWGAFTDEILEDLGISP